jgi:hypothetical protein
MLMGLFWMVLLGQARQQVRRYASPAAGGGGGSSESSVFDSGDGREGGLIASGVTIQIWVWCSVDWVL